MSLADGAEFAGYTVLRQLGSGGMGEVYLVQHPRLPRQEALKVLPADISADPDYRVRFAREADLAASLWNPHIVEVHDRGEDDGQLWITMDYVAGTDAARLIRDDHPYGMPLGDALEVVSSIADALDYAHHRRLLHRDVKPANILIADAGAGERRILLADFGIARDTGEVSGLTATNVTVGTVDYAAPEQLLGRTLDGRADQYSLACTAFHLLTGRPPFADTNPAAVINGHISHPAPRPGTLRRELAVVDAVLARAMAKQPEQRFGSCTEFAAALTRCTTGTRDDQATTQAAAVSHPHPGETVNPETPRDRVAVVTLPRRTSLMVGGMAALAVVGSVAFAATRLAQPQPAAHEPAPSLTPAYRAPDITVVQTAAPPVTITQAAPPTVTITRQATPSPASTPSPPRGHSTARPGDLGLATPISFPNCNGQGIVILGSVTTPGLYAAGVQRLLDAHPGSFYLRTDQSCPSLRHATADGNPIYAVFTLGGKTPDRVCAAVYAAGGNAYGKWLDTATDPGYVIPC